MCVKLLFSELVDSVYNPANTCCHPVVVGPYLLKYFFRNPYNVLPSYFVYINVGPDNMRGVASEFDEWIAKQATPLFTLHDIFSIVIWCWKLKNGAKMIVGRQRQTLS